MKGNFKKVSFMQFIFASFFTFTSAFTVIRFTLWGLDEIQIGNTASAAFCFAAAAFGILFVILSFLMFIFNKDAFLSIENNKINARFGFNRTLHIRISDLSDAEIQGNNLILLIEQKQIRICRLNNAKELCEYLKSRISEKTFIPNIEKAQSDVFKYKKRYLRYLYLTIGFGILMFLNIALTVLYTGAKGPGDYSQTETAVFIAFLFVEITTVLMTFISANKSGKSRNNFYRSKQTLAEAAAFAHKEDALNRYPNLVHKKYFHHYTYRIVIFSPEENIFAYMLEHFDCRTDVWLPCYESAIGFEILSELYNNIEESFSDVIFDE